MEVSIFHSWKKTARWLETVTLKYTYCFWSSILTLVVVTRTYRCQLGSVVTLVAVIFTFPMLQSAPMWDDFMQSVFASTTVVLDIVCFPLKEVSYHGFNRVVRGAPTILLVYFKDGTITWAPAIFATWIYMKFSILHHENKQPRIKFHYR